MSCFIYQKIKTSKDETYKKKLNIVFFYHLINFIIS